VFNEDGNVIGYVQGGTIAGAKINDIVPIAVAADLARKNGVDVSIDKAKPFQDSCYSKCRAPEHGVEKWRTEQPWRDNTNKLNGGGGERQACDALIASKLANSPPALGSIYSQESKTLTAECGKKSLINLSQNTFIIAGESSDQVRFTRKRHHRPALFGNENLASLLACW